MLLYVHLDFHTVPEFCLYTRFSVALRPLRLIRDGKPRTTTSTFTYLLSSESISVHCCFTSTGTIRTIRDGEGGTATSTFTQLMRRLEWSTVCADLVYFRFLRPVAIASASVHMSASVRVFTQYTQMSTLPFSHSTHICLHSHFHTVHTDAQSALPFSHNTHRRTVSTPVITENSTVMHCLHSQKGPSGTAMEWNQERKENPVYPAPQSQNLTHIITS